MNLYSRTAETNEKTPAHRAINVSRVIPCCDPRALHRKKAYASAPPMSGFERVQLPSVPGWKQDVYVAPSAKAKTEWFPLHPQMISQEVEDAAWASRSWDQQLPGSSASQIGSSANPIGSSIGGSAKSTGGSASTFSRKKDSPPGKRATVESDPEVSETEPGFKKMKIHVACSTSENVCLTGNIAPRDVRTVADIFSASSEYNIRAMWLIVEPSTGPYDAYGKSWFRPATQLCEMLEKQLAQDIGCQSCTLTYDQYYGPPTVHYFEHDLRGDLWMQRRFYDAEQTRLRSEKQIMRVLIGT